MTAATAIVSPADAPQVTYPDSAAGDVGDDAPGRFLEILDPDEVLRRLAHRFEHLGLEYHAAGAVSVPVALITVCTPYRE